MTSMWSLGKRKGGDTKAVSMDFVTVAAIWTFTLTDTHAHLPAHRCTHELVRGSQADSPSSGRAEVGWVKGPGVGSWTRSLDPPSPPSLSCPPWGQSVFQGTQQKCSEDKGWKGRHQITLLLGLRRIVAVGQRRQGLKAAPPPRTRLGLHTPLLFIFTQNVFGFFCIPQRALSIFFLQPLSVLEKLKKTKMSHTHLHSHRFYPLLNGTDFVTYKQGINRHWVIMGLWLASQCQAREITASPRLWPEDMKASQTKKMVLYPKGDKQKLILGLMVKDMF